MAAWKAWEHRIAWSSGCIPTQYPPPPDAPHPRRRPTSAGSSVPCPPPAHRGRCRSTRRAGGPGGHSSGGLGGYSGHLRHGTPAASGPLRLLAGGVLPGPGRRWPPKPSPRRCEPCPGQHLEGVGLQRPGILEYCLHPVGGVTGGHGTPLGGWAGHSHGPYVRLKA